MLRIWGRSRGWDEREACGGSGFTSGQAETRIETGTAFAWGAGESEG